MSFCPICDSPSYEDGKSWMVDNGASCHVTRIWDVFLSITLVARGVGHVRFQVEFGETLEVGEVHFVAGLKANLLSLSVMEGDGYATLFKMGHVFIYSMGVDLIQGVLLGDQQDRMHIVRGQPMHGGSRWISNSLTVLEGVLIFCASESV